MNSVHKDKATKAMEIKNKKLPGGLLLNNGIPTTNATRLPSVVKKKHDTSLQSEKGKGNVTGLLRQEFKPKIKSRTNKKEREEFLAEERRRKEHEQMKESARQKTLKKDEVKKLKDEERKRARLAGASVKQQNIVTLGVGNNKNIDSVSRGRVSFVNGRGTIKQEVDDDAFIRKTHSNSRRITDSDDEQETDFKKGCFSSLYTDNFIRGNQREVFSNAGPVRLPLVSWTVQRKRKKRRNVTKAPGKLCKKMTKMRNAHHMSRRCVDYTPAPSWCELKKLGKFDNIDPLKHYMNPVSSGLYLSTKGKDKTKTTVLNPKSSITKALLNQFLHPERSDIVLIKVPPLPICSDTVKTEGVSPQKSDATKPLTFSSFLSRISDRGGCVGKIKICKSGLAFLCIDKLHLELDFASNPGNIIDLVKFDMDQLKAEEVENSKDIMGKVDCLGNAGVQLMLAPKWDTVYPDSR